MGMLHCGILLDTKCPYCKAFCWPTDPLSFCCQRGCRRSEACTQYFTYAAWYRSSSGSPLGLTIMFWPWCPLVAENLLSLGSILHTFTIQWKLYDTIGSLLPPTGDTLHDSDEVQNHLNHAHHLKCHIHICTASAAWRLQHEVNSCCMYSCLGLLLNSTLSKVCKLSFMVTNGWSPLQITVVHTICPCSLKLLHWYLEGLSRIRCCATHAKVACKESLSHICKWQ